MQTLYEKTNTQANMDRIASKQKTGQGYEKAHSKTQTSGGKMNIASDN